MPEILAGYLGLRTGDGFDEIVRVPAMPPLWRPQLGRERQPAWLFDLPRLRAAKTLSVAILGPVLLQAEGEDRLCGSTS
jgi:hypothetical protein